MALYNLGAISATQGKTDKVKEFWNKEININSESEIGKLTKDSLGQL